MEDQIKSLISEAISNHYEEWDNDGCCMGICTCGARLGPQNRHHTAEEIILILENNGFRITTEL